MNAAQGIEFLDYFEDIDRLYEFPDDHQSLRKVVKNIHYLDRFRSAIIRTVRWDISKNCTYDKRRTIYVCISQTDLFLINSYLIIFIDFVYHGVAMFPGTSDFLLTVALQFSASSFSIAFP